MVGKAEFFRGDVGKEAIKSGKDNLTIASSSDHTTVVGFKDNTSINVKTIMGDRVYIADKRGNGGRIVVFLNGEPQSVVTRRSRRKGDGKPGKWVFDSEGFRIGTVAYYGKGRR
jgi:hypothetical protein